jgi:hypothetical protein
MALAQDRLDRRRVEDGGLQAGHGPGQGGGVGAGGAAAHLQQPARPLEGGQAGQLAREPGGQPPAPGRDAGVAVADAVGQAGPGLVEEPLLGHDPGHRRGCRLARVAPSGERA